MPRPPEKPVAPRPAGDAAVDAAVNAAVVPPAVDDEAVSCAVFDDQRGRPCGQPVEAGTLTCTKHRVRPTRTQISRNDAARRRFGG